MTQKDLHQPAIRFDLVVERTEYLGDRPLLREGGQIEAHR
jgi:hypothetical protein